MVWRARHSPALLEDVRAASNTGANEHREYTGMSAHSNGHVSRQDVVRQQSLALESACGFPKMDGDAWATPIAEPEDTAKGNPHKQQRQRKKKGLV